jgi:hypothetical protein
MSSFPPVPSQASSRSTPGHTGHGIPFTRIPHPRVRAANKDLSSGDSVRLTVTFLGEEHLWPVTWTTDQGNISSQGDYTAPAILQTDTFAHVSACVTPDVCDSILLAVHPFLIGPPVPTLSKGDRVQLSATVSGGRIAPSWSQLAGGGTLSPAGEYVASTALADGGGIPISASYAGSTQKTSIAVTGLYPGLVNRISDYVSLSNPDPRGTVAQQVTTADQRAYVQACDRGAGRVYRYCWIDCGFRGMPISVPN